MISPAQPESPHDGVPATPAETATAVHASASPAGTTSPASTTLPLFLIIQLGLAAGVFAYGTSRYQELQDQKLPPTPQVEPVRVGPLYDKPAVISDDDLTRVLGRLQPKFRGVQPKINHVDHALRFWGVEAKFTDENALSGSDLRGLLTDHRMFATAWGTKTKPFLLPDTRDESAPRLAFRTKSGPATASHLDHTLAGLAEVGTPLDYPVRTPSGELPLRAAFDHALSRFSLNQDEYEWSTLVFLHYLPHVRNWFTSEGQLVTWDMLADRLMRQRLAQGVCHGNHRLHALALLLRVDVDKELLSADARQKVIAHLQDATKRLSATQHEEGWWDGTWPGEEWDGPQSETSENPLGPMADRLIATGHALEWWAFAPQETLPSDEVLQKAGQWLVKSIDGLSDAETERFYPFLTHAGRALALWRGKFPSQVSLPAPAKVEAPAEATAAPVEAKPDETSAGKTP